MEFGQWNSYILDFLKTNLTRIYNNTILNVDENQKVNVLQKKNTYENNSLYESMLDKTTQSLEKIISNTESLSKIQ